MLHTILVVTDTVFLVASGFAIEQLLRTGRLGVTVRRRPTGRSGGGPTRTPAWDSADRLPHTRLVTRHTRATVTERQFRMGRIPVTFEYDPADPYAINLIIRLSGVAIHRVRFARSLLRDAIGSGRAGMGDVRCTVDGPGRRAPFRVNIDTRFGPLHVTLRRWQITRVLTAVYAAVPDGAEVVDIDRVVARLLTPR